MKKIFLMLLLVFCVVSCELKKAQEAYDKKEYLESMKIVLKYFEKYPNKLEKIKPEVKNDLMGKFSNIVNIYEGKAYNGNFDEKIEGYSSLGQIYMLMDKYSISQQFTDFTQKHNLSLIYENYENMISQRIRSNVDRMSYENIYKMIKKDYNKHIEFTEELMASNIPSGKMAIYREVNKKMTKSKADKLIELAQKYEYLDKYREAEKLYLEASKTYSRYDENYRQAKDKHFEIKRKADLIDAEKNYNLGLSKTREGTKASYRKATEYFEKAARFIPNYKNSKELARKYEEMGNIDYYISDCPNSVENSISSSLSKIGRRKMSSSSADVVISCNIDTNYRVYAESPRTQRHTETRQTRDASGTYVSKQYIFEEIKKISTETMDVRYRINLSGMTNRNFSGNFSLKNEYSETIYTGDVPENYKSVREVPLGRNEMKNKAYNTMEQKTHMELEELVRVIKNL
ncbi:tetratricopeptide repeat protein [Leptotrichia trevisanii]